MTIDLTDTEDEARFRAEACAWLQANVPSEPLPSATPARASVDKPLKHGLTPVPGADPALDGHARALVEPPVSQPEEVAAAIAYLGSAEARFATGAVLRLDGGAGA